MPMLSYYVHVHIWHNVKLMQSFSNQPLFLCYYRLGWVQSAVALEKRLVTKHYG